MEMFGKVRRMYKRDKKSLREIAKGTGLSRNTIRKWVRDAKEGDEPEYRRKTGAGKLTAFHAALELALKADALRAKQYRRTARALFVEIKNQGYTGGYSRVTDFIREWRGTAGKTPHAFVPLSFALGEAFQFDWSTEGLLVGGIYYNKVQLSHMKLCASRAFWLVAYPSQGHEMLFDAHTRSFAALGGVPGRGIYDNMRTAVDKVQRGKERIVNARFTALCAHYLFDADFCNVASGWEKGVVEKNVQDSRRRIWLDAQKRKWSSFDEINAWLGQRCRECWSELRHPEFGHFSVLEMLEQERLAMMPMPKLLTATRRWRQEMLDFFDCPVRNDYVDSIEKIVQVINRQGHGYGFAALRGRLLFGGRPSTDRQMKAGDALRECLSCSGLFGDSEFESDGCGGPGELCLGCAKRLHYTEGLMNGEVPPTNPFI